MIKNRTRSTVIAGKEKTLTSISSKALGLMFSRPIHDIGYIFVFEYPRKIDLHMFFVFFPIDVLFLDEKKKVVEIKENFSPFSMYYSEKKASYVIELEAGTARKSRTRQGDTLEF